MDFGKPSMLIEETDSHMIAYGKYNKGKRYIQPLLAPLRAEPSIQILGDVNLLRGSKRYDQNYSARDQSPKSPSHKMLDTSGVNSLLHIH